MSDPDVGVLRNAELSPGMTYGSSSGSELPLKRNKLKHKNRLAALVVWLEQAARPLL